MRPRVLPASRAASTGAGQERMPPWGAPVSGAWRAWMKAMSTRPEHNLLPHRGNAPHAVERHSAPPSPPSIRRIANHLHPRPRWSRRDTPTPSTPSPSWGPRDRPYCDHGGEILLREDRLGGRAVSSSCPAAWATPRHDVGGRRCARSSVRASSTRGDVSLWKVGRRRDGLRAAEESVGDLAVGAASTSSSANSRSRASIVSMPRSRWKRARVPTMTCSPRRVARAQRWRGS